MNLDRSDIPINDIDSDEDARLLLECGCSTFIIYYSFQSSWLDRKNCKLHFHDGSVLQRGAPGVFRDRDGAIEFKIVDILYGGFHEFIILEIESLQ